MKNYIYIFIIAFAFVACKGTKGDIGPQGDQGAAGAAGANGTVGAKGATGDTGATGIKGATGTQGSTGTAPSTKVFFTDWTSLTDAVSAGSTSLSYNYSLRKQILLSFLPNIDSLSINYFSNQGMFLIKNTKTGSPVGSLFYFHSINALNNNEQVVFSDLYSGDSYNLSNVHTGFFAVQNFKTIITVDAALGTNFLKSKYASTEDFQALIKKLAPKMRFIYIPIDLTTKGRTSDTAKTYEEILEMYDIPKNGSSVVY